MPRSMSQEKAKNFSLAIKRLLSMLGKKLKTGLIIATILASISSISGVVAPNILSKLTDRITDGLIPNTKAIEEVYEKMYRVVLLSAEDREAMLNNEINNVSDEGLLILLDDIKYDNKKISKKDIVKSMRLTENTKYDKEEMVKVIDKLPKSVYEIIRPRINMEKVKFFGIILGIIYVVSSLFGYIQAYIMAGISNKFSKNLRTKISYKINKLPLKYFDSHETGDILSRITNDVDSIGMNLNRSISSLITNITLFLGTLIMMFVTSPIMALTALGATIIGILFSGMLLKKSQKYFIKRQEKLGDLNGYIEEIYSGLNVVKTYNATEEVNNEFDKINEKLYLYNRKSQFLSGIMQPIMRFVGNFGYVAVCVVGALLTVKGSITIGTIVAFMIYIRLFTNPLSQIAGSLTGLQSVAAASERVFEFLDEEELKDESEVTKKLELKDVKGSIEFKHVKFGYDKDKTIIKDFNVKVKPGEKVAIVGPTGAGKTTIVNLLMKFYEINEGEILIDGISTKDLTRENIHDLFVMVLQDTWLFDGTIKENIRFNSDASDEKIKDACKTVGISHFIKTLPNSYDSLVADNDAISGGEKQLLTIARGMIKDTPFLILDEATSNVDTRTEELVQKAMDQLTVGKTSFIIAHRLSTIKNADLILVMKDGDIIETGSHDKLMKQNGFYAELYNSQFEL